MKFKKLKLSEDLLDYTADLTPHADSDFSYIDDDYKALDYPESMFTSDDTEVKPGPKQGSDVGIADCIMNAITEEFAAIKSYNSIIATMKTEEESRYDSFVTGVKELVASTPEDAQVFSLNTIDKIKYEELKTIIENIKRDEQFGFEYSSTEEEKPIVLTKKKNN